MRDAEDTDLATGGSSEDLVAIDLGEGVVPHQTSVWQLAGCSLHVVLHRGDIELKHIDVDLSLTASYKSVGWMLWIDVISKF